MYCSKCRMRCHLKILKATRKLSKRFIPVKKRRFGDLLNETFFLNRHFPGFFSVRLKSAPTVSVSGPQKLEIRQKVPRDGSRQTRKIEFSKNVEKKFCAAFEIVRHISKVCTIKCGMIVNYAGAL